MPCRDSAERDTEAAVRRETGHRSHPRWSSTACTTARGNVGRTQTDEPHGEEAAMYAPNVLNTLELTGEPAGAA
ncbi:hypothetical protein GCM10010357_12780 [Streptomyces luteireticuli]|uniref:Uncharacterized protein n=1 Tax=Streptomyces luteireticuli TaxID=173858 RepID=A0ABN0YF25_9ACTN